MKTGAAPTVLKVGPSSPPAVRRWNGFTMDIKEFLSKGPRIDKVTVLSKTTGEETYVEMPSQQNGEYLLQRVGSARYVGDGAGSRYKWASLEVEQQYQDLSDGLGGAMRIPATEVKIVEAEATPAAQPGPSGMAVGEASDDREM